MRNRILLLLIVFGLYCCTPPKYITKKQSEIVKLDLDNSITNYIPIADSDLKNSIILDSTYHLIVSKKYSKLDKYINYLETSGINTSDFYLSKSLLFIARNEYFNATKSVQLIKDSDYRLLKRLLTIDLNYEVAKLNGGVDYILFLNGYQDIIDSFPDDSSLKKIVAIRLRYLRYNY